MSIFITSLLAGIGIGGWIYFKVSQRTGGAQLRNSIILSAVVGIFAFFVMYAIMETITGN